MTAPVSTWTDSHCHLERADDLDAQLTRALEAGVDRVVCIGTDVETSAQAVSLARRVSVSPSPAAGVWSTVGLHPHDATDDLEPVAALLADAAAAQPTAGPLPPGSVVGVGECGLDYFYEHSPRAAQREVFARQVALAHRHALALVVHTRDAFDDTCAILAAEGVPERTVIHCFSGGLPEARRLLDLGASLSFSGIVTFKNAAPVREAAAYCPDDRLLVETDAPFLAPVPHRGRPNEPAFVALVGTAVAELRDADVEEVARRTAENAARLFRL